jgi:phosphoglycerate dehydrogenase-like enzyme
MGGAAVTMADRSSIDAGGGSQGNGSNRMSHRVVVLDVLAEARVQQMRALLPPGFTLDGGVAPGEAAMQALIADADFAITGQVAVSGDVLRAGGKLKLLHKWGVGVDNIDVAAAKALGVRVARTTGSNAMAVAEFTLGLMLSATRFLPYGHHMMLQGEWRGPGRLPGESLLLTGRTVGIVGLGAIGTNVARLLRGFGCTILYAKRNPLPPEEERALGVRHASIDEIIETSDVVSLHCPLTPETEGLFNAAAFRRMKRSAVLVNVARGGVVNEADLCEALKARTIRAAAMDVFSVEPLPGDSPLLGLDNIVVTPHLAASTADTFEPTVRRMYRNMEHVARGEPVPALDSVV